MSLSLIDTAPSARRIATVPEGTEARGFVLYVGINEATATAAGTNLGRIVDSLKRLTLQIAPGTETHAVVALAPRGIGGSDVEVVRLALNNPRARERPDLAAEDSRGRETRGIVVDISRKRVLRDGVVTALTYREFEILHYLVVREGRTVDRAELIASLWTAGDDEVPNQRTIDVHVRRLRSKLGRYEDIVRTVRGIGYRFDRHADVHIRHIDEAHGSVEAERRESVTA